MKDHLLRHITIIVLILIHLNLSRPTRFARGPRRGWTLTRDPRGTSRPNRGDKRVSGRQRNIGIANLALEAIELSSKAVDTLGDDTLVLSRHLLPLCDLSGDIIDQLGYLALGFPRLVLGDTTDLGLGYNRLEQPIMAHMGFTYPLTRSIVLILSLLERFGDIQLMLALLGLVLGGNGSIVTLAATGHDLGAGIRILLHGAAVQHQVVTMGDILPRRPWLALF